MADVSVMLWPGTHGPATATPPRVPGSVRRTSTVDIRRPDGLLGNLMLEGRAREVGAAQHDLRGRSGPHRASVFSARLAGP